jgi:hypothetical protein
MVVVESQLRAARYPLGQCCGIGFISPLISIRIRVMGIEGYSSMMRVIGVHDDLSSNG